MADDISHMTESIDAFAKTGRPTGDCLKCILSNDLFGAFARADDITAANMQRIVRYIFNETPRACWGSPEAYDAWLKRGGLEGDRD